MIESLETGIEQLNKLDKWRVLAAQLRDSGKKTLRSGAAKWHEQWLAESGPQTDPSAATDRTGSQTLEDATVLRALLCHRRSDHPSSSIAIERLVKQLEALPLEDIASTENDNMPILRAARILTALGAAPDSALSQTAIYCYYVIMRELYTGGPPDWLIGGARGGEGLPACAFVTNECIHALLSLNNSLAHTAEYIERLDEMLDRRHRSKSLGIFAELEIWQKIDDRRAKLDFQITSELRKENIALKLPAMEDETIAAFLLHITENVRQQVSGCVTHLKDAIARIEDDAANAGIPATTEEEQIRRAAGHATAMAVLRRAYDKAKEALSLYPDESGADDTSKKALAAQKELRAAAAFLRYMAHGARAALEPSAEYVSRALDRELTAASSGAAVWDVGELLFAAISHGYISGRWEEERLRRAAAYATAVISERGHFRAGQPIHISSRGYYLRVPNVDVIRAFAELLHHTKSAVLEPTAITRLMHFIDDTVTTGTAVGDRFRMTTIGTTSAECHAGAEVAWVPSEELRGGRPWRSATASTVLALDGLNRMLDIRINDEIFQHFSVHKPVDIDAPHLEELFYPDFGLVSELELCDETVHRPESVAVTLQRMRAHVRGVRLGSEYQERLYSLILHGPPGTGKSTLVEALAKSSGVVLVEVTPSDLIAGGVDAIERTAGVVFQALSLLTRVVIVFDEFDPVLLQRQDDQKEATQFSFLTPGMLPKLKSLHRAAGRRSVAYVLNTNRIGKLDDAAIRGGRFDAKVGVYPPDVLSRAGRLASAVSDYYYAKERKGDSLPPDLKSRFERVVLTTRLGPMNTLGKPGWFTRPSELRPRNDIFNYLFNNAPLPKLDPEAKPRFTSERDDALHELQQFVWVDLWDRVAEEAATPLATDSSDLHYSALRTLSDVLQNVPQSGQVRHEVDLLRAQKRLQSTPATDDARSEQFTTTPPPEPPRARKKARASKRVPE